MSSSRVVGILALLAMLAATPDFAQAQVIAPAVRVSASSEYVVSGILRKGSENMTIKLLHSVEIARSEEEAIGLFTRRALDEYPGYSLLTTLASPGARRPATCGTAI